MTVFAVNDTNERTSVNRRLCKTLIALCLTMAQAAPTWAAQACATTPLSGANVAGAEFNGGKQGARVSFDYVYPAAAEVALLQKLDLKLMRVPFLWERIQPKPLDALDAEELAHLDAVVAQASASGMTVVLDVHNYGTYRGTLLDKPDAPRDALPDLWKRLAQHFGGNPKVVFGLMNEPHEIDVDAWAAIAKATLASIRATGAPNIVLIPGTNWDGAHSWLNANGGHSNAEALLPLARGDNAVVFEVHQYFDGNFSGTAEVCDAAARVPPVLTQVGAWARAHHVRLMLGEFGVSQRPECVKALDDALAVIEHDRDVWYGWTYWAAGAWWGPYPFNIQTSNGDTPQGKVLQARAATLDRMTCKPGK
jgi:endoglucanase